MLLERRTFPCPGGVDRQSLELWIDRFTLSCKSLQWERVSHSVTRSVMMLRGSISQTKNILLLSYSPILYSIAGLGIAIVNDFKSIEGDRAMGLQSLPVAFGIDKAKWICAGSVTLTQLGVAGYLFSLNEPIYAAVLLGLILPQMYFQATLLLPDPVANDVKYQASAQPFLVFGILATALCIGHHEFTV